MLPSINIIIAEYRVILKSIKSCKDFLGITEKTGTLEKGEPNSTFEAKEVLIMMKFKYKSRPLTKKQHKSLHHSILCIYRLFTSCDI